MKFTSLNVLILILAGCVTLPDGVKPINDFDASKYLGKWYEIARLDNRFEQGMHNVTAEYQLLDDKIKVINRGYNIEENEFQQANGVAYPVSGESVGHLKVSFFRPFYGSYVIFHLDKESYQYSFVSGGNKEYLWLLARKPDIDQSIKDAFVKQSKALGFNLEHLIWVNQETNLIENISDKTKTSEEVNHD
ncbi:MAG: lipocalin family protein [Kangiellaceae bacterium]